MKPYWLDAPKSNEWCPYKERREHILEISEIQSAFMKGKGNRFVDEYKVREHQRF